MRPLCVCIALVCVLMAAGCTSTKTTNTARTAKEQLLVSNSIDQSLDKVDFAPFAGYPVFLQDKYLDCVDKNYVLASIRHRAMRAGATLVDKPEDADIVMEVRSGSVGTDMTDMYIGIPEIAVPGPLPIAIPQIKFLDRSSQKGIAKIGIVAYDAQTKQPLGSGGVTLARADDNNWYFFGLGPYQNGSVKNEVKQSLKRPAAGEPLPSTVAFRRTDRPREGEPEGLRYASEEAASDRR